MMFLADIRRRATFINVALIITLIFSGASCTSSSDPIFEIVRQAFQNYDKDTESAYRVIHDNLGNVKDKQIIPFLIDVLKEDRRRQISYVAPIGEIVFYFERISGIKSHIKFYVGDPAYSNGQDAQSDIEQWQTWWDTNKDYLIWDATMKGFKVIPH